jgi:multimeric flavodoxin WrbA
MKSPAGFDDRSFLFLLTSGRADGNAEILAHRAANSLPQQTKQTWLDVGTMQLPIFADTRHSTGIHPRPEGDLKILFEATLAATDLVFVIPVYWYGVPAQAKLYLDHWTHWLRLENVNFRSVMSHKTFWAISVLSDREARLAEPTIGTIRLTAEYLKAPWGGSVLGFGNRPGDILHDRLALEDAEKLFATRGDLASSFT